MSEEGEEKIHPAVQDPAANTCPIEYFCEVCGHYPLIPVHGHFECPVCRYKTKCCEGM